MKYLKLLFWLLVNVALGYCLYLGINGVKGASNVFIFLTIFSSLVMMSARKSKGLIEDRAKNVIYAPYWMVRIVGVAFLIPLVWYGWWVTAIFHLVGHLAHCELIRAVLDSIERKKKEDEELRIEESSQSQSCGKCSSRLMATAPL